ncbi:MAG: pseudouridine synthase [Paracoccus sp. (in: a-proteobacteria)]|nr:pseudouridine synthase [Paracoccus sp. (in: a-proteobacteria)]
MTDDQNSPENSPEKPAEADRIAKVMARSGIASRREAERMILEGRVSVNGQKIDSPALDVLPSDRIMVDGRKLDEPQETRLWLYYKPVGLVTSEADEKGRQTVFDALPRDLPRVMSVGRLDLNSEGLLLLTNDGALKRRLELPETGWLRRYRVRVNGQPNDLTFAPLRRGVTIEGEEFAPMEIKLDSQQGANAWLTVGIREGRNREIRRAMAHVGLQVNRLIRIGYGPFKLTGLEPNEVREVKRRVLRDQLGGLLTGEAEEKDRPFRARGAEDDRGPRDRKPYGEGRPFARRADGEDRAPRGRDDGPRDRKPYGEGRPFARRDDGPRDRKPFARRADGEDRAPRGRDDALRDRKPYGDAPRGEAAARKPRHASGVRDGGGQGGNKPFARREDGARGGFSRGERAAQGEGASRPARQGGGKSGDKPFGKREGRPFLARDGEGGARASGAGDRGFRGEGRGKFGAAPGGASRFGDDKPRGAKPYGGKPGGGKMSSGGKPGAGPRSGTPGEGKPADRTPGAGPRSGTPGGALRGGKSGAGPRGGRQGQGTGRPGREGGASGPRRPKG